MALIGDVTDGDFEERVLGSETPVLVDFWAEWCVPCHMVSPVVEEIGRDKGESLEVAKLTGYPPILRPSFTLGGTGGAVVDKPEELAPKLAWALRHRDRFPLDVNTASREQLLRVPGFGLKTVERILSARRIRAVRADDLKRLHVPMKAALPFIVTPDHRPTQLTDRVDLASLVTDKAPRQLSLFADAA